MYGYLFNNLKEGRLSEDDVLKIVRRVKEGEDVGDVLGEDEEDNVDLGTTVPHFPIRLLNGI